MRSSARDTGNLQAHGAGSDRGAEGAFQRCASCWPRRYAQEPNEKAALFRVIGEIADQQSLPELIGRVQGKDPIARVHIINTLARFNTAEVQTALAGTWLKDPNKLIRGATLSALAAHGRAH